jgi:hypothetical protein
MARYFFHVVLEGRGHTDVHGREFPDLKGAKAYAARIARELARCTYVGSVCIVDKQENELDRVSIGDDVVEVQQHPTHASRNDAG